MGPGNGAGGTQSHREWDVGTGTQRRAESGGWGGRRDGGEGGCGDTRGRAPGCGAARRADVMRGDSRPNEGLLAGGDGPAAPGPVNKLSRAALMGPGAGRHQGRARAGNEAASRPRAAHGAHRSAAGAGMRCGRAWGGRAATSRHGSARAVQHTRGSAPGFGRAAPSAPPPHRHAVPVGRSPVRFNRFIPSQTPFGARRRRRPRRSHSRSTWKAFPCCCSSRWCCRRSSCRSPRSASRRSCGDGCEPTAAQRGGPGAPRGRPGGTHRHQLLAGEAQLHRQAPAQRPAGLGPNPLQPLLPGCQPPAAGTRGDEASVGTPAHPLRPPPGTPLCSSTSAPTRPGRAPSPGPASKAMSWGRSALRGGGCAPLPPPPHLLPLHAWGPAAPRHHGQHRRPHCHPITTATAPWQRRQSRQRTPSWG